MSDRPLIPDSWALPVAAYSIGVSVDEAQRMIDNGELELTIESIARAQSKRSLDFLDSLT